MDIVNSNTNENKNTSKTEENDKEFTKNNIETETLPDRRRFH